MIGMNFPSFFQEAEVRYRSFRKTSARKSKTRKRRISLWQFQLVLGLIRWQSQVGSCPARRKARIRFERTDGKIGDRRKGTKRLKQGKKFVWKNDPGDSRLWLGFQNRFSQTRLEFKFLRRWKSLNAISFGVVLYQSSSSYGSFAVDRVEYRIPRLWNCGPIWRLCVVVCLTSKWTTAK